MAKKKGAETRMKTKRPMVLLPEELHFRLRLYALEHGKTVKEVVGEVLGKFLDAHGRKT